MNKILLFLFLSFSVFAQKPQNRFEKEILAYEKQDSIAMPAKGMKLFIGSSSFRLWKTFDADTKGMNALNRGFGGSTLKEALYYFDRMVATYQPSWVFMYEGDNDLTSGQSPEEIATAFELMANAFSHKTGMPAFKHNKVCSWCNPCGDAM